VGTIREWLQVAFFCVFWGGWMLAWETRKRKAAHLEPALLPASILVWFMGGLNFGLIMAFGWRVVQRPIVFILAASFVIGSAIGMLSSKERSKAFKQRQSWTGIVLFLSSWLDLHFYSLVKLIP
jgi:hypothetical protein